MAGAWLGWAGMGCLPSPAFRPPPSTWLPSLRASHPSHTHLATRPSSVPRLSSPALHLATHTHTHTHRRRRDGWGWDGLGWAGTGMGWAGLKLGWAWLGWAGLDWARSRLGWAGLGLAGLGRGLGWLRLGWAWLGWAGMGCLPSPAFRPPRSTWLPSVSASNPSHSHLATHPPSVPRLPSPAFHLATHTHTHTQEKERWLGLGWAGLGWAGLGWAGLGWAWLGWAGMGCLPSPAFRPPPSTWLPSLRASHPSHTHLATHPPSVPRLPSPALHLATHNSCGLVAAQALEEGRGHIEMVRGQQTPSCSSSKDLKHG